MMTASELNARLAEIASRSMRFRAACRNEESTKLYLVLPFLAMLGYDLTDPSEIYPEHSADFDAPNEKKVDIAVLRDGRPIIAIECKKVGTDLANERGQLRSYFNALLSAKVGMLTNGIVFEFFVDAEEPNIMDDEPFLTIDLETISTAGAVSDVVETLLELTKGRYSPESIAEIAHIQLVRGRLRTALIGELASPSEDFCRVLLQKVGIRNLRRTAIERNYGPLIKAVFAEALVMPIAARLRTSRDQEASPTLDERREAPEVTELSQRVVTSDRELAVFNYVKRRLAFLVSTEAQFAAIDKVSFKDYVGKFALFYDKERKGRLFDFIEARDGADKFVFPEPIGEIVTANIREIDEALLSTFVARVKDLNGTSSERPQFTLAQTG
jgi:hypothetical protein